jgi:GNAT superfamily N-acetyltransferase
MILGRVAVDKTFHGQGVGTGLLRDAVFRIVLAAEIVGIRAILVHAISETAKRFYEKYGFVASPIDPLTVMITLADAIRLISAQR